MNDKSPTSDSHVPADSWEEAADAATPSPSRETPPTPEDGDDEDQSESDAVDKKKKPAEDEEEGTKKEPVNVIFIGHVGMQSIFYNQYLTTKEVIILLKIYSIYCVLYVIDFAINHYFLFSVLYIYLVGCFIKVI